MIRTWTTAAVIVGLAAHLSSTLASETQTIAIRDVSIVNVVSDKILPDRTILIRGERIRAIGTPQQPVAIPDGAKVIAGRGKYVIPGLIDAHVHLVHLADRTHVTGDEYLPLFLAAGVTSVRGVGDAIVAQAGVAHFAKSHPQLCPRVFLASPLIDRDPPVHKDVGYPLTDVSKVAAFVDDMAKWRVTTLKLYVGASRPIAQEVIKYGHGRGMKVTAHLSRYSAQDAIADGVDCLEHITSIYKDSVLGKAANQPDRRADSGLENPKCQALVALLAESQVAVVPTLVVFRNMIYLNDVEEFHKHPDVAAVPGRMREYWESYRNGRSLKPETRGSRRNTILKYCELTGILHRAGVPILAGTDAPEPYVPPGFSLHQELELLVDSGLSPTEALKVATINNASILNQADNLGGVEAGKLADLVILTADPTENIRNTRKIETVIRGGRVCYPATLRRAVPRE